MVNFVLQLFVKEVVDSNRRNIVNSTFFKKYKHFYGKLETLEFFSPLEDPPYFFLVACVYFYYSISTR